ISNGAIDRGADTAVEYTFSADLGGVLSGGGEAFDITADLSGDFFGLSFGAVAGVIAGTAITGSSSGYLFGNFIAAQ
ncbi:MAG: hypothetical protein ACC619_02920, partial [Paracoccaceae bacterium]